MYLPYVIDNRAHCLADVLNDLLREGLETLDSFRLRQLLRYFLLPYA
jgi:hypothetical protein